MKKYITILTLLLIAGCTKDPLDDIVIVNEVPEALQIAEPIGLKLESAIVTNKVAINAKFDIAGTYRIKILDIGGKIVSQEKISAEAGDNLLNIYTSALDKSGYQVQILDDFNNLLGVESFVIQN